MSLLNDFGESFLTVLDEDSDCVFMGATRVLVVVLGEVDEFDDVGMGKLSSFAEQLPDKLLLFGGGGRE